MKTREMKATHYNQNSRRTNLQRSSAAVSRGFTLVEMMVVVAILLVVIAIALPSMVTAISSAKLRGGMSELSGIVQTCRSQAVRRNETRELFFTTSGGRTVAYVDVPGTTDLKPLQQQVWLNAQFSKATEPTGGPTKLDGAAIGGGSSTPNSTDNICFNSRGIPCSCPSSVNDSCVGITNGYAYYFSLGPDGGNKSWAAVGVSPAGRIKTLFWNGSAWAN